MTGEGGQWREKDVGGGERREEIDRIIDIGTRYAARYSRS